MVYTGKTPLSRYVFAGQRSLVTLQPEDRYLLLLMLRNDPVV